MSFFKACFLAVIATLFLTYVLGATLTELLDINVVIDDKVIEPLKVISVSALVAVFLVIAAIAIVVSVFGTVIFAGMLLLGGVFLFFLGIFWPFTLILIAAWLIVRDKKPAPQY